jgi:hypothetical protein
MREGGQRTQPLGIRREARLSPSQTCSIPSSSVSRARCGNCFAAVPRHRCSIGFSSGLSHCGAYPQLRSGLSRARPCACEREQSPLARRGKPSRIFRAHSSGPEPAVHAPLAGPGGVWHNTSADIVHEASCGPIMPSPREGPGHALSNPTLHIQQGPSSKLPT